MAIEKLAKDRQAKFDELARDIAECKAHIRETQEYMAARESELLSLFSQIDPTGDFEGTESFSSDLYQVSIIHKLTKKINKEEADFLLKENGKRPEELFNVKYDYSATLFKTLDDEEKDIVLNSLETKRAKTSIDIRPIAKEK